MPRSLLGPTSKALSPKPSVPKSGSQHLGISENRGTLFWGPYNKDPTI